MVAQVENWDSGQREAELTSSPFAADAAFGGFAGGNASTSTVPPPVATTAPPTISPSTPYSQPRPTLAPEPKRRGGLLALLVVAVLLVIVYVVRR
jgi:hypothetical protein